MAMRVELDFAKPLDRPLRTAAALALAALAGVIRVRFGRGDRGISVSGEAVSLRHLAEALAEVGLVWEKASTSLDTEEDRRLAADAVEAEKVRPMGR